MKVKIKATGFGATALKDGTIIHFDISEADKPKAKRDMRKLEAEVDIADAERIRELGWGDFKDPEDLPDGERAELGDEVQKLEQTPEPEAGKPSQSAPPANRDDPAAQVKRAVAARPKRPSEIKKAAEKAQSKGSGASAAQPAPGVQTPAQQAGEGAGDGEGDGGDAAGSGDGGDDPDAGPKT